MKICFVSHSSAKGGGERSLLETIHALLDRGVRCVVLLPRRGPLAEDLRALGVECAVLPYRWWVGPEGGPLWRRAARLVWNLLCTVPAYLWIRRWDPDLVYSNTLTVPVGAFAAAVARRGHVWHIRELGHEHNRMVFDLGERTALRVMNALSALILANSECVARRFRPAFGPGKIGVVYQAVEPDLRPGPAVDRPRRGFRCVAVGSISPAKRQEEAIEAVALLRAEGRDVELLIAGEGDPVYERHLRDLTRRLGLEGEVAFLGEVPSAWPVLRGADAVVQCSRREAFGRVTVEGMLAARPVVGARDAGTAELIHDGRNGLLYEPGDVDQLAAVLRRLMDRPDEAARIGARARDWAAGRFSRRRYGEEILDRLRDVRGALE
jgi:glycosyltransferase involved in cell wall biosynthesis